MIKKFIHIGLFALIQFFLSISTNYFITKLINPSEFGIYILISSIAQFIAVIISLGSSGSIVRFAKILIMNNKIEQVFKLVNLYSFILYVLTSIILIVNISFFSNLFFSRDIKVIIYILIILIPFVIYNQNVSSLFWGHNDFIRRGLSQNFYFLIQTVLILIIYLFFKNIKFDYFFSIILISTICNFIFNLILTKKYLNPFILLKLSIYNSTSPNNQTISFLKFGIWTSISTISLLATDLTERLFIKNILNSESLGFYLSLFSIFSYIFMPFQLISNVFLSFFITQWEIDKSSVISKIQYSTILSVLCLVLISILFYFFYEPVILIFFGKSYLGLGKEIIIYFTIVFALKIIYSLTSSISFLSENSKSLGISLFFSLVMACILYYLLIPEYGIYGVLYSGIIYRFCQLVFLYLQYYKNNIKFSLDFYLIILFLLLTPFLLYL